MSPEARAMSANARRLIYEYCCAEVERLKRQCLSRDPLSPEFQGGYDLMLRLAIHKQAMELTARSAELEGVSTWAA